MNRRNFFKKAALVTGTLAFAPTVAIKQTTYGSVDVLMQDIISQQMYYNRLITLYDYIIGLNAKTYPLDVLAENIGQFKKHEQREYNWNLIEE